MASNNSYNAQLQIRRDAEDNARAQSNLGSWLDELKTKPKIAAVSKSKKATPKPVNNLSTTKHDSTAEEERNQGNEYFSKGKYEEAVLCYTQCLNKPDVGESKALVYSNRAMAHIKLKNWKQAEEDSTSALEVNPHHFKSYQRRCVARLSMGKLRAAMLDVCSAQDTCIDSQSSLAEINKLRLKVEKALVAAAKRAPRRKL